MRAVILAGGKGTRLAPYTKILPKPLVPIGDMPIMEVMIRQLRRAGIDEIILAVGHLASLVQAFFGNGSQFGVKISYSYEEAPLGTIGPLALMPRPQGTFLVMNGDILTTLNLRNLLSFHKNNRVLATIAMHKRCVKIDLGVIECNADNRVTGYLEKPAHHYAASMGVYVFEPRLLDHIPPMQYLDFPDLINRLIQAGEPVAAYPFEGYWQDLGRPDDYEQAARDFETMREQFLGEE